MTNHSRFVQAALALLLASERLTSVNAAVNVCGETYGEASSNCKVNPKCANGDGCPADKNICYEMPDALCFESPTPAPSESPTTGAPTTSSMPTNSPVRAPLNICGSDYNDAVTNCRTADQCLGGDGALCGDDTHKCYVVPPDLCPLDEPRIDPTPDPSPNPTEATTTAAQTPEPTPSPTMTMTPKVCGANALEARANCLDMAKRCATGEACFTVPANVCGVMQDPTMRPTPDPVMTMEPTSKATTEPTPESTPEATTAKVLGTSPTMMPKVCGANASDAQANCLDMSKSCATGNGCPTGEACFNVAAGVCGVTQDPTTTEPTETAPTMLQVTPTRLSVCGSGYSDATQNPCTNQDCSSGDGCGAGETCYALPYQDCSAPVATTTTTPATEMAMTAPATNATATTDATNASLGGDATSTQSSPSTSPTTETPTKSPIFNKFFCGEDYKLAEQNCWTAEACPSGTCSKSTEQCYGISLERCLSPAPTDAPTPTPAPTGQGPRPSSSPTVSSAPSSSPTMSAMPTTTPTESPSKAPVVNTNFCGDVYSEAEANCSEGTACGSASSCPNDMTCYTGIQCAATAEPPSPAIGGGEPTTDTDGGSTSTTSRPTTFWDSITGNLTGKPTSGTGGEIFVTQKFCGTSFVDATNSCATAIPCPSGLGDGCLPGQSCFPIMEQCNFGPDNTIGQPIVPQPNNPTAFPTKKPAFDPDNKLYCGVDYDDAEDNCYMRTACINGATEECPDGQGCYTINSCVTPPPTPSNSGGEDANAGGETPPPTMSMMPTNAGGEDANAGGEDANAGGETASPTAKPTMFKPTWNSAPSSSTTIGCSSLVLKSLVWGGAILGAIVF